MIADRSNARIQPPSPPPVPTAIDERAAPHLEQLSALATSHADDPMALLALLRQLEQLHRSIQEGPFRSSLPSDRSSLFRLLQSMEQSGGWPYIPRLQLRTFLDLLHQEEPARPDTAPPDLKPGLQEDPPVRSTDAVAEAA
ncbi:MAG: hypothetical protein ACK5QW_08925 [Cyanobacteriota bacterium]